MEDKSELLQYAREYANTQDLYALLGVTSDDDKPKIHSKWRKASVRYHPDKTGDAFDPAKWELLERARDVLSSPEARQAYDAARAETLRREQQRAAMDAKRRAMVEDLEARERGVKRKADGGEADRNMMSEAERRRLAEAGRRRMEERRRLMEEAEARDRERERERQRAATVGEDEATKLRSNTTTHSDIPSSKEPRDTQATVTKESAHVEGRPEGGKHEDNDGYDERIADIERRLQDIQARKADKKARKSEKKARRQEETTQRSRSQETLDGGGDAAPLPSSSTATTVPPPAQSIPDNTPAASRPPPPPSFKPTSTANPISSEAGSGGGSSKTKFASTMARLRAAQAAKEAKKKQQEKEASTTTAGDVAMVNGD
ncbi:hypothetical protein F4810DRAFT_643690 [Camillea tinctor]|nr:hypothetical protein F4810DRAFT_643690 [Camillea tinctor]